MQSSGSGAPLPNWRRSEIAAKRRSCLRPELSHLWSGVLERMALDDAFAFADHDPLIGVYARYLLHFSLRPADRQVRFVRAPKAEVDAEISL
jgi:hypothetical protein